MSIVGTKNGISNYTGSVYNKTNNLSNPQENMANIGIGVQHDSTNGKTQVVFNAAVDATKAINTTMDKGGNLISKGWRYFTGSGTQQPVVDTLL